MAINPRSTYPIADAGRLARMDAAAAALLSSMLRREPGSTQPMSAVDGSADLHVHAAAVLDMNGRLSCRTAGRCSMECDSIFDAMSVH